MAAASLAIVIDVMCLERFLLRRRTARAAASD